MYWALPPENGTCLCSMACCWSWRWRWTLAAECRSQDMVSGGNIGKYHLFRQLWLVLGVKLMEISSNWFWRSMVFLRFSYGNSKGKFTNFGFGNSKKKMFFLWVFLEAYPPGNEKTYPTNWEGRKIIVSNMPHQRTNVSQRSQDTNLYLLA